MTTVPSTPTPHHSRWTAGVAQRFAQIGVLVLLQAALLFTAAGRLDWRAAWAYLGLYLGFIGLNALLLLPRGTALIEERARMAPPKGWDRVVMSVYSLAGLGVLVVAGLDQRWAWTPPLGTPIQVAAWLVMAAGYGLFSWAMAANAYFSAVVRVQAERGHQVVTGGPYRWVRHPGYVGLIVFAMATPLMLGSLWAFIPAGLLAASIVVRTRLEDQTLRAELPGYGAYAGRVRYRLLPGVW